MSRSVRSQSNQSSQVNDILFTSRMKKFEWPVDIDIKLVNEIQNRLNLVENDYIDEREIKAYLGASKGDLANAFKSIQKVAQFKRGQQLFYQDYRCNSQRYLFLKDCRTHGFGKAIDGRIVFYEKISENFNLPLYTEFTQNEIELHTISWCENLKNNALANSGTVIQKIPIAKANDYIIDDETNNDDNNDNNDDDDDTKNNDDINNDSNNNNDDTVPIGNCEYSDVYGIIDWDGLDSELFLKNSNLIKIADDIVSTKYPHLIYKLIHINMPLSFGEVFQNLLDNKMINELTLQKSVFLDSDIMKKLRLNYVKESTNNTKRRPKRYKPKPKPKSIKVNNDDEKELIKEQKKKTNYCQNDHLINDEFIMDYLLNIINKDNLPNIYGGNNNKIYKKKNNFVCSLIGASADSSQYDEPEEKWRQFPIRKKSRETITEKVSKGEHYHWEFTMEKISEGGKGIFPRVTFGMELEITGYRNKTIKILVREENEYQSSYYPMFGDFIILKDGKLIITFKNDKHNRIEVKLRLKKKILKESYIAKYLPNYSTEEKQSEVNNQNGRAKHGTPTNRSRLGMLTIDKNARYPVSKSAEPVNTPTSPNKRSKKGNKNKGFKRKRKH